MAQIGLRIDDDVKKHAELICDDIGLTLSAAITVFLKKVVKEGRIPFELTADPFYSQSNIEVLLQSIQNANEGKLTSHELIEE